MPPNNSTTTTTTTSTTTQKVKCVVLGAADAGKTSLLRRYFRDTFALHRVPTVGSDFYTKRTHTNVLLQMFDTPGEIPVRRMRDEDEAKHMESLLAAFVGRVDGVLLVYDMTNSTSFTQLRLWHGQWRKRCKRSPILIVGNKRDLIPSSTSSATMDGQSHAATVPQRDVLGFRGSFKGKDFRYEYRVDHQVGSSQGNTNTPPPPVHTKHHRHEISTFTSTATNVWTQDGTYLDSLLGTEDRSNPDRDMVKLWCMRNGLQHVEVSALEEEGGNVDVAMQMLVELVLQSRKQQQPLLEEESEDIHSPIRKNPPLQQPSTVRPNRKLDLLERYRPKHYKCCFGLCPTPPWSRLDLENGEHPNGNGHDNVLLQGPV